MVETAIVLFLLLLLVFGITEFGRALFLKNTLNNAARAGARYGAVRKPFNAISTVAFTRSNIYSGIKNEFLFTNTSSCLGQGCIRVDPETDPGTGGIITVKVRYNNFQTFVPKLIPIGKKLTGEASMRVE